MNKEFRLLDICSAPIIYLASGYYEELRGRIFDPMNVPCSCLLAHLLMCELWRNECRTKSNSHFISAFNTRSKHYFSFLIVFHFSFNTFERHTAAKRKNVRKTSKPSAFWCSIFEMVKWSSVQDPMRPLHCRRWILWRFHWDEPEYAWSSPGISLSGLLDCDWTTWNFRPINDGSKIDKEYIALI